MRPGIQGRIRILSTHVCPGYFRESVRLVNGSVCVDGLPCAYLPLVLGPG
jgi:hypothetical protein